MPLDGKQLRFCQEYIVDLNATQAAIRAGYSQKTAGSQGHDLLKKPEIEAEIQRLADKRTERVEIRADDVLRETYLLATSDLAAAFNDDGSLKPIKDIPPHIRRAISSVEVDELFEGRGEDREHVGYTRKIRLWDKVKTLELLGKHLRLFSDTLKIEAQLDIAGLLAEARQRVIGGNGSRTDANAHS